LRMIARRSLNGSFTIVGDIAQATGAFTRDTWDDVIEQLPKRREPERRELLTGYRIPAPAMEFAAQVLAEAAPGLTPPVSIRSQGDAPRVQRVDDVLAELDAFIESELASIDIGNLAVVVPRSLQDAAAEALSAAGRPFGEATRAGLQTQVALVPVQLVKGLEVDAVVVVEPSRIVSEERQGMRALYVALTRATKRVGVIHQESLPPALAR